MRAGSRVAPYGAADPVGDATGAGRPASYRSPRTVTGRANRTVAAASPLSLWARRSRGQLIGGAAGRGLLAVFPCGELAQMS
jgi:hypothetical protein